MADMNTMDWDDAIEKDSSEFRVVPEGEFNFTVKSFERGRFPGSEKLEASNMAEMVLDVETEDGVVQCFFNLILNRKLEWKISEFFRAIGQKKPGEKFIMDWNKVPGSRGRAYFKPRKYKDKKDGSEKEASNVDHFIDYDEKNFPEKDFMDIPAGSSDTMPFVD